MAGLMTKKIIHNGIECYFYPDTHRYIAGGKTLVSATQFVDGFFPPFDAETIAGKYAAKHGLEKQSVLEKWENEGAIARELGTIVHEYAEYAISGKAFKKEMADILLQYKKAVDKAVGKLKQKFNFINAEKLIFSARLGIAGTVDLLMQDKENKDIVIFDWKTNKKITKDNIFQTAREPISHKPDCNFSKYCLQLNLYRKILDYEKYFPAKTKYRMALIHLTPPNVAWHKIPDQQKEIEAMLKWI